MPDIAETPKIIQVADGLFVRQEIDNITWIDLGGAAVVVDTLEKPETEAEVFAAIAERLGGTPVRWVLNTHTHYDHIALNDAFVRRCGAEVVNARSPGVAPDGRWFEGTRRKVQMLPMPGCHTDEDCVVWCPDASALLVGDIFGWGLVPLTRPLRADTVKLLETTYRRLIDFGARTVIPGHGPLCTTAELRRWVEYLHWLIDTAVAGVAARKSDEEIAAELAPPEDMKTWWRFLQWKHADSVEKVVSAARRGRLG